MKKLILLALILSPVAVADYVSPSEYKDYTCEELREDYKGVLSAKIDNISEQIDVDYRSVRHSDLEHEYVKLKSRSEAIEKAGKRIDCEVNPKPVATAE